MDAIFTPLEYYLHDAKERHAQKTLARYEELEKKSGVSLSENAETVRQYDAQVALVNNAEKAISTKKTLRTLGIIFSIVAIVAGLILGQTVHPLLNACIPVAIVTLILVCSSSKKAIASLKKEHETLSKRADELYDKARAQTAPLCALFTGNEATALVEEVVPGISFDEEYCAERLAKTHIDYGYFPAYPSDQSVVATLSGELRNRPFLFNRRLVHNLGVHTYHGAKTISWQTRVRNSQGQYVMQTRTEVLHASIVRPKPYYDHQTELVYCHEGAPDLNFSRTYAHAEDESEKSLERKLRKGEKKLLKKTDKSLKEGGDFIATANTDFEVLFNATSRSDEIAFRTMFTAQAQRAMVDLLLSDDGYGDDFEFEKQGKINRIRSEHAQNNPITLPATSYYSHDISEIKRNFLTLNEQFFKGVFFDFAPLLLIPPYQTPFVKNVSFYGGTRTQLNREELVNRVSSAFTPEGAHTPSILKTALKETSGTDEIISVLASAYTSVERIEYVPKFGGDGKLHHVPVPWTEYIPVSSETTARISKSGEVTIL